MPDTFHELLDATIQHLEELKSRGVRFVPVSADTIAALGQTASLGPARRAAAAAAPPAAAVSKPIQEPIPPPRRTVQPAPIQQTGLVGAATADSKPAPLGSPQP